MSVLSASELQYGMQRRGVGGAGKPSYIPSVCHPNCHRELWEALFLPRNSISGRFRMRECSAVATMTAYIYATRGIAEGRPAPMANPHTCCIETLAVVKQASGYMTSPFAIAFPLCMHPTVNRIKIIVVSGVDHPATIERRALIIPRHRSGPPMRR